MLTVLFEEIIPIDFYFKFIGIFNIIKSLKKMMKQKFADLLDLFSQQNIELEMIFFPWIICLFTMHFRKELILFIWSRLFVEGEKALLKLII